MLAPSRNVPAEDRAAMLDWVDEHGGTLIVGHPILGEENEPIENFAGQSRLGFSALCSVLNTEPASLALIDYLDGDGMPFDGLPSFGHSVGRVIPAERCSEIQTGGARSLLVDDQNRTIGTIEPWGAGTVVQLAEAAILGNEAIGAKATHLFAMSLVDRLGRDVVWAFDEAHEGILPEPKFVELIGSSRYRPVFMQLALLLVFAYWWRVFRLGRPRVVPSASALRDVAAQAKNTGDFYHRARKSAWALSRAIEFLKLSLNQRGLDREAKQNALEIIALAEKEQSRQVDDVDKHVRIIQRMARVQSQLISKKGKANATI